MAAPDLDAAADGLYHLLPSKFVAARDAAAAEARAGGDRTLAAEIKALRRPTLAAWMINWLARERANDLGRLLELGAALRIAQDRMAGEELRTLSRQRHAVVAALASDARRAASDAGLSVGDATSREVEETLNAALADDRASAAVRAGRLSSALRYSGFGTQPAGQEPPSAAQGLVPESGRNASPGRDGKGETDLAAERQRAQEAENKCRLDEAEADLRAARSRAADAHREADDHGRRVEESQRRLDQLRQSVREAEARLDALRQQEGEAFGALRDAEDARGRADRLAAESDDRAAAAQAEVEALRARAGL